MITTVTLNIKSFLRTEMSKANGWVAYSVDPDQMPCSAASEFDLHWLLTLFGSAIRYIG